jgi:hypothetical protein
VDVAYASPPESEEFGTLRQPFARKPGDLDVACSDVVSDMQLREGDKPQAAAESVEKSDAGTVPKKPAKTWVTPVELVKGKPTAKGKSAARNARSTQREASAPTDLQRIGQRAKKKPKEKWTNLVSHLRVPLLKEAYMGLRKDAASGVDEVTWYEYGEHLDERLQDLENRVHRGGYHPQPVLRVHIPKGDGKTRPLGIPALEDKLVQQATRMILEPIYEAEFIGFSYGFRPGRSAHDALDALAEAIGRKVSWVLDADIQSFFGAPGKAWRFQRVQFPPRQGAEPLHRESSLGLTEVTTWAKRRQSDTRAVTQVKQLSSVRTIRRPTGSKIWKAMVGNRKWRWLPETPAGSESTARVEMEASRNLGDPTRSW